MVCTTFLSIDTIGNILPVVISVRRYSVLFRTMACFIKLNFKKFTTVTLEPNLDKRTAE